MDHFAGLDVSVKETSICIVDDTGRIVREVKVASEPEALLQVLRLCRLGTQTPRAFDAIMPPSRRKDENQYIRSNRTARAGQ